MKDYLLAKNLSLAGKRDAFDTVMSKFLAELNEQYSGSHKSGQPSSLGSGQCPYQNNFHTQVMQGVAFDPRSAQDHRQMPSVSGDMLGMPSGTVAGWSIRQQHTQTEGAESQIGFVQGFEGDDVGRGAVNPVIHDESFQPYPDLDDFENDVLSSAMMTWES